MTANEHPALAAEIDSALRATPGVRSLYRSGSLVSNLVGRGAAALGLQDAAEPFVRLSWSGDEVAVEASVAIDAGTGAAATLRSASSAVAAVCASAGVVCSIRLTVVHIQEGVVR
ncbi:hypothetical protein [Microbacterium sp. SD291]|uniref:hypothetical protein n=1 Tax=Microbacterium sp. SD291 TaxID=2782007 RepID=UPI001A970CAB|nr:hypothetical protein [Microbacterium sp. SD291]MBO0981917.1 hypothetical protein [Microbacterium sp. SD291]